MRMLLTDCKFILCLIRQNNLSTQKNIFQWDIVIFHKNKFSDKSGATGIILFGSAFMLLQDTSFFLYNNADHPPVGVVDYLLHGFLEL